MSSIAGHLFLCSVVLSVSANQKTTFVFPEFPYKETNKNEMAYREYEAACEQNPTCALQKALPRLKCVRECISPVCYQQIYYQDQGKSVLKVECLVQNLYPGSLVQNQLYPN